LENPGYTIFRKCFCLLPNFKNASLKFNVRSDDAIQVWFNTQTNVALPPHPGNHAAATPWSSQASNPKWFRVGRNCIYVLLEDVGGFMGFDLVGTIQAEGLMPLPASGVKPDKEFECPCRGPKVIDNRSGSKRAVDDKEVIRELTRIAEKRRLERAAARDVQQP
jgi:hypothetical protein